MKGFELGETGRVPLNNFNLADAALSLISISFSIKSKLLVILAFTLLLCLASLFTRGMDLEEDEFLSLGGTFWPLPSELDERLVRSTTITTGQHHDHQ